MFREGPSTESSMAAGASSRKGRSVMNMVKQLGYKPNPAGKALAARRHRPIVGVILNSEGNAFFDEIIRGIETAESVIRLRYEADHAPHERLRRRGSAGTH